MTFIRRADVTPYAASLIEGLRDFGYSLETAMADIIDNSITAGASRVDIQTETTSSTPWIAIIDNGKGMDEAELIEAMRLGTKNPLDTRELKDLGRFGLGLKSASFSQCRALTVITRKNGVTSCAAWDLDQVNQTNKWEIDLIDDWEKLPGAKNLAETGTVVLWQKLDRLDTAARYEHAERVKVLNEAISKAVKYLQLVFHRFMSGTPVRFILLLNGSTLHPHDPFAAHMPARQSDPEEILPLPTGQVIIQSVTLPHHKRMTVAEWDELGRGEGILKTQGFYVYRAERLIIAGSWLGITKQTELTKLARVRVDIPNSMDADWKIDVKKASAQLPVLVRRRLATIIERIAGSSRRVYHSRGRRLVSEEQFPLWHREIKDGQISFRPNISHSALSSFSDRLPKEFQNEFAACIKLLGAALPLATLHADIHGTDTEVIATEADSATLRMQAKAIARFCKAQNLDMDDAQRLFRTNELLKVHWATAKTIVEEMLNELNS